MLIPCLSFQDLFVFMFFLLVTGCTFFFPSLVIFVWCWIMWLLVFVKSSLANAGDARDVGSIPGSGRSGEGNDNPLQYTCLKNHVARGTWKATVHEVAKSWIWLSTHTLNLVWLLCCQISKYYCTSLRSI